jgi:hypothetical protein
MPQQWEMWRFCACGYDFGIPERLARQSDLAEKTAGTPFHQVARWLDSIDPLSGDRRSPWVQFVKDRYQIFCVVIYCCWLAIFVAGNLLFPHAPISPQGSVFVDKLGTLHTAQDYYRFKLWERMFIVASCVVFPLIAGRSILRHLRKPQS